jgi:hypothetical protein
MEKEKEKEKKVQVRRRRSKIKRKSVRRKGQNMAKRKKGYMATAKKHTR